MPEASACLEEAPLFLCGRQAAIQASSLCAGAEGRMFA